jgi:hypothetical protein
MNTENPLNPRIIGEKLRKTNAYRHERELHGTNERVVLSMAAKAIAGNFMQDKSRAYTPETHALNVFSHLGNFYESQSWLNDVRAKNHGHIPRHLEKPANDHLKEVLKFNRALKELINVCGNRYTFDQLSGFLVNGHQILEHGKSMSSSLENSVQGAIIGMRNELAIEQMLSIADIDYSLGTIKQDMEGGDFIINGYAIDVTTSPERAREKQAEAQAYGNDPSLIVYSDLDKDDFMVNGVEMLALPYSRADGIAEEFIPRICAATRLPVPEQYTHYPIGE